MSHLPSPATAPPLRTIAETVHRAVADPTGTPVAQLVSVELHPTTDELSIGFWDLPPAPGHPVAPIVGFLAPTSWDAIGLISSGRLRHLDEPATSSTSVVSTVMADRSGQVTSVLGGRHGDLRILDEVPEGVVPDVLARVLGRPTPAPQQSVAALVDLTWLDRLAGELLPRPGRGRSWRWLADRHPLRGTGPVPEPVDLAIRTAAYGAGRSWFGAGPHLAATELPAARWGPPGGTVLPAGTWFDEGSLARWILRDLPPPDALVPDLLAILPPEVGEALLTALCEVGGPDEARAPWRR